MRDEFTRRGVNTGENGINGITFLNGRVIKFYNVNIKAPDVLCKPISNSNFLKRYIPIIKFKLKLPA
jgi:hypothetical protein